MRIGLRIARKVLTPSSCRRRVATQLLPRNCCHATVATQLVPRRRCLAIVTAIVPRNCCHAIARNCCHPRGRRLVVSSPPASVLAARLTPPVPVVVRSSSSLPLYPHRCPHRYPHPPLGQKRSSEAREAVRAWGAAATVRAWGVARAAATVSAPGGAAATVMHVWCTFDAPVMHSPRRRVVASSSSGRTYPAPVMLAGLVPLAPDLSCTCGACQSRATRASSIMHLSCTYPAPVELASLAPDPRAKSILHLSCTYPAPGDPCAPPPRCDAPVMHSRRPRMAARGCCGFWALL